MKYLVIFLLVFTISGCNLLTVFRPNLVLTPEILPDAVVGKPYKVKISVSKEETPVSGVSINDGEIPDGLTMQKLGDKGEIAEISGIPQNTGEYTFALDVWCYGTSVSGQTIKQKYKIVVKEK